ncbi:oligosaccharide flippase family protein [Bacillus cereus]|uniref:oligosaccharide flippase family protein n=1 Tax=Bacillus cereus TaxID=1396 RepID=UPI003630F87F
MNLRLILKNASFLFVGNVLVRMLTAISAIVIARYLGAEQYGILSIALVFSTFASSMTDLGLTHTFIREGTKADKDISKLLNSYLVTRLFICIFSSVIVFILVNFMYSQKEMKQVIFLMVIPTIFGAALQNVGAVYYQIIEKMKYTAIIRIMAGLISVIGLLIGVYFGYSLLMVALTYGLCSILGGIISISFVINKIKLHKGLDNSILNGLSAFTLTAFLTILMPLMGPIALEKVSSLEQVGYFNAALRIPSVLYQIPGIVAAAFYPVLFKLIDRNELKKHGEVIVIEIKLMTLLSLIMVLPIILFPEEISVFLLGKNWIGIAETLSILSIIVFIQSINFPLADSLTTKGLQKYRSIALLISFGTGIFAYSYFGKLYGSLGSAIAAVLIEIVLLLGLIIFNKQGIFTVFRGSFKSLLSLIFLYVINKLFLGNINIFISLVISYLIILIVILSEKGLIKNIIQKKKSIM